MSESLIGKRLNTTSIEKPMKVETIALEFGLRSLVIASRYHFIEEERHDFHRGLRGPKKLNFSLRTFYNRSENQSSQSGHSIFRPESITSVSGLPYSGAILFR